MGYDDDFRDLRPLSPRLDAARWERLTRSIEGAATAELARRAMRPELGIVSLLGSWLRPAASVAFSFACAAGLVLGLAGSPDDRPIPAGISDGLGYPGTVAVWVETGWTPSVEELLVTLTVDRP